MINEILKASRNNKCSDIHISANTGIKVRQDGYWQIIQLSFLKMN